MTPRALRSAIQAGEMTSADPGVYRGKTPAPPPEWPEWRRERMRVAIAAAIYFLKGKRWQEISSLLEKSGGLEAERVKGRNGTLISKARVNQYVDKGVSFLVDRGCFVTVKQNGEE